MRSPTVIVRGEVLSSWLTVTDYSKSQLATDLDISKGRVSQLLTSHTEPSAHLMAKLLMVTHLPFDRLFRVIRHEARHSFSARSASTPRKDSKKVSSNRLVGATEASR